MALLLSNNAFAAQKNENVLKTEEKEAQIIDDTKMQETTISKKETKKLEKEAKKLEELKRKEELKAEKENKKLEKERLKAQKKAEKNNAETEITEEKNQTDEAKEEIVETKQEAVKNKKINKDEVEQAFSENSTEKKELKAKKEIKEEKEEIIPVSDKKEEVKKETTPEEIKEEPKKEEATAAPEPKEEIKKENKEEIKEEPAPDIYRKNLTYEDIDKNAVSINEFLQFTEKQNEKFSIFYYKTTSKLSAYTKQIKNKENLIKELKKSNMGIKEQYEKLKKADRELETLLRERDDFYNSSLEKFNSILTKKQAIKWELLQQMGYRFIPEFD